MMNIQKSHRVQMLKAAAIIPLAALAVTAFASNKVMELTNAAEAQADALVTTVESQSPAFVSTSLQNNTQETEAVLSNAVSEESEADLLVPTAEQVADAAPVDTAHAVKQAGVMPKFDGNVFMFLAQNIKYPESAVEANIQGRVLVKFIVSKDGEVCNASVVRSVDPSLDAEALRVINAMPRWTPGTVDGKPVDVWFTLPVTFRLTDSAAAPAEKTVVVVDGKVASSDALNTIDKSTIASIDIKKDEATKKQYGIEGEGSVLLVTTKK